MKEQTMNLYFSVCGMQIPIELKPLYQEVSMTFEKKVMDAIKKTKQEEKNEMAKKISKKSNNS
jgi:hypothetical protein